jgi:hypothetical protein
VEVASLRHFLIGLFKIDPPRTFNIQYSIENIQSILLVPEARIELARTQGPLDFESSASTNFTTPASTSHYTAFKTMFHNTEGWYKWL